MFHMQLENSGWAGSDTLICVFAVLLLAAVLIAVCRRGRKWSPAEVSYGALSIAMSFALSFIKLYSMPTGGSVTLASMLPVMLFASAFGPVKGLLCGMAYGVLQCLQGGWIVHPVQFLLDYPLAFAMLGLSGIRIFPSAKGKAAKTAALCASMLLAAFGRALCATLAGVFFWNTAFFASVVYNGAYLLPDIAICMLIAVPAAPVIIRMMRSGTGKSKKRAK